MMATIGASLIHFVVAPYLAINLGWGFFGVSVATAIHWLCRSAISLGLVWRDKECRQCLIPITHEDSWKGLGDILKWGFNSFLLSVMGWWAFDVFTQLATQVKDDDDDGKHRDSKDMKYVAAQTVMRNIGLFTFMIPVGLSSAAGFIVGRYIGKGQVDHARKSY